MDPSAPVVFTVADVMSSAECAAMIARIEELKPTPAPISAAGGFVMRPDIRNNTRVMFDDHALAAVLMSRLEGQLPARLRDRRLCGVNERFRCYRYQPGQRFAPHYDGCFERSAVERSELTLMIYLNDTMLGGATVFHDDGVVVVPCTGTALVFRHAILHEGATVESGVKYVLRSDVMYRA